MTPKSTPLPKRLTSSTALADANASSQEMSPAEMTRAIRRRPSLANCAVLLTDGATAEEILVRQHLETLLRREGAQRDELLFADRRLLARSDPSSYMRLLLEDDMPLRQWAHGRAKRYVALEAALRMQTQWRATRQMHMGAKKARRHMEETVAGTRRKLRREIAEISLMREDVRESAMSFFTQLAPFIAKRVVQLRRRLTQISDNQGKAGGGHKQVVNAARKLQEEILKVSVQPVHVHVHGSNAVILTARPTPLEATEHTRARSAPCTASAFGAQ